MAKQKIVPGDVLIVDEPYISTLFRDHQPTHCYHCFRRLPSEPGDCVPSPHCDKVQLHNLHFGGCPRITLSKSDHGKHKKSYWIWLN